MKQIAVIHGPNLNLLGTREPDLYGFTTLAELDAQLIQKAQAAQFDCKTMQSNHEGEIVAYIQRCGAAGLIINPAALTHTSVAIRDAIAAIKRPVVEVHLSNIYARESFRHHSYSAPVCSGQIAGLGINSYFLALNYLTSVLA